MTETKKPEEKRKPARVEITLNRGWIEVHPVWEGVDRSRAFGIALEIHDGALAGRLAAAYLAGAAYEDPEIRTDVNGKTYVNERCLVHAKTLSADLRKLGY